MANEARQLLAVGALEVLRRRVEAKSRPVSSRATCGRMAGRRPWRTVRKRRLLGQVLGQFARLFTPPDLGNHPLHNPGVARWLVGGVAVQTPVGADNAVTSRDLRVLVEEPAEPIASPDADHHNARPGTTRERDLRTLDRQRTARVHRPHPHRLPTTSPPHPQ